MALLLTSPEYEVLGIEPGGTFEAEWLNPRTGVTTPVDAIEGGRLVDLPVPPGNPEKDWALRIGVVSR